MSSIEFARTHCKELALKGNFKEMMDYLEGCDFTLIKFIKIDSNTLNSLRKNEIWISRIDKFNDNFDTLFRFPTPITELLASQKDPAPLKTNKTLEEKYKEYQKKSYAFCLAESSNLYNLQMWNFYGDNYKGVCVEYKVSDIVKRIRPLVEQNCQFAPVNYDMNFGNLDNSSKEEDNYSIFFSKALCWQNEKEWRFSLCTEKCKDCGIPLPFIKPIQIYFGPLITQKNKALIESIYPGICQSICFNYKTLCLSLEKDVS